VGQRSRDSAGSLPTFNGYPVTKMLARMLAWAWVDWDGFSSIEKWRRE
jgi:hypothetical protein